MLEVKLLGTGGVLPSKRRMLTSMLVTYNNDFKILFDCGEGTQLAFIREDQKATNLDAIYLSNFHREHVSGLMGMIELMKQHGKTTPLTLIGPKGIAEIVKGLMVAPEIFPFKINYLEFDSLASSADSETRVVYMKDGLKITAFRLRHSIPSYGYTIEVTKPREINKEVAEELGLEDALCKAVLRGETLTIDGKTVNPEVLLEKAELLAKVTYCMDTGVCSNIVKNAMNSNVFIVNALRFAPKDLELAAKQKYLGVLEAAKFATECKVRELWLVGTSSNMIEAVRNQEYSRNNFQDSLLPEDGHTKVFYDNPRDEYRASMYKNGTSFF